MKKWKVQIALISLFCLIRIVDLHSTLLISPDLEHEQNWLVKIFGFGWPAMIMSSVISIIVFAIFLNLYISMPSVGPLKKNESFSDFVILFLKNNFFFVKTGDKRQKKLLLKGGYFLFIFSITAMSILAAVGNYLQLSPIIYTKLFVTYPLLIFNTVFLIIISLSILIFLGIEFKSISKKKLEEVLQSASDRMFPAEIGEAKVYLDSRSSDGDTALHIFIFANETENALILIENGIDINAIGDMGNTALHVALCQNNKAIIKALLDANARTDIMSEFGKTALDLARENGITI